MKILIVYPDVIGKYEQPIGLLTLISVMKKGGHELCFYSFPICSPDQHKYQAEFKQIITKLGPQIVAFSMVTHLHDNVGMYYKIIKKFSRALILEGGIHATMFPDEAISNPDVDIIAIGECETTINELLIRIQKGQQVGRLPGYWYKHMGQVIKNPIGDLPDPLDELPFPDRSVLAEQVSNNHIDAFNLMSSRGCPFECSYCHNIYLKDYYKGKGKFVRFRSPENIISELKEIRRAYPSIKKIIFSDDNFALNKKRLIELCKKYKQEIGFPFICHARVENIDDEVLCSLKEANCVLLNLAIETANDHLRHNILNRKMTKENIRRVFRKINEHGLRLGTFVMLGVPEETKKTIWETIKFLREFKINYYQVFSFTPLKKTPIYEYCLNKGYKINKISSRQEFNFSFPVVELDTISKRALLGYLKTFHYYVKASRVTFPLIHLLRMIWEKMPNTNKRMGKIIKWGAINIEQMVRISIKKVEEPLFGPVIKYEKNIIN